MAAPPSPTPNGANALNEAAAVVAGAAVNVTTTATAHKQAPTAATAPPLATVPGWWQQKWVRSPRQQKLATQWSWVPP